MLFVVVAFILNGIGNHMGPECNMLTVFKYGEGFD